MQINRFTGLSLVILSVTAFAFAGPPEGKKGRGPGGPPQGHRGDGPRGGHHGRPPMGPPAILKAIDANGDQKISKEEMENAAAALKKLDKNGDGVLTPDEFAFPGHGGAPHGKEGHHRGPGGPPRDGAGRGRGPGRGPADGRRGDAPHGDKKHGERGHHGPPRGPGGPGGFGDRFKEVDKNGDGKVSKEEIRMAESVMNQMGLEDDVKESAKKLFNEGKSADFPIDEVLLQFKQEAHRRSTLIQMFIEIQVQAAYADGVMDSAELKVLHHICDVLNFSRAQFEQIEQMVKAGFSGSGQSYNRARTSSSMTLDDAYKILGVDSSTSARDVKRAYRRLMSQHHPDKLVAKGLPEEMIKAATEKTQKIKEAYELIKKST